jgi:hypothetical protein
MRIIGFTLGLGGFTVGHTGLTWVPSGFTASASGFHKRKVGSQMREYGFSNGDGDCQSDRQAPDFKLLSWFQNGEIWVPTWGNVGSTMRMVITNQIDRR